MVSRLDAISPAVRPRMNGRALISGPSGAGKTWTALSMATRLAVDAGKPGSIIGIDTEKESMLTYADVFKFDHLPWRAPFDPTELTTALGELGDRYAVIIADSFSHFWRGQGGTLEIADSKFGGWKNARPVQERVTEAILAVPCHVILCVRSKMDYLVVQNGQGKQEISKVGLAPIQDETLVYEMNVALDIDLEHRINVVKSRTPAVPVGRMYPAGLESKCAEDYAAWLAGGIPPAAREEVDALVESFAEIVDADLRKAIKQEFVLTFGQPVALTADKIVEATAWLAARVEGNDVTIPDEPKCGPECSEMHTFTGSCARPHQDPPDGDQDPDDPGPVDGDAESTQETPEADPATTTPDQAPEAVDNDSAADPVSLDGLTGDDLVDAVIAQVKPMTKSTMTAELLSRGIRAKEAWTKDTLGRMLASTILKEHGLPITAGQVGEHAEATETATDADDTGSLGL